MSKSNMKESLKNLLKEKAEKKKNKSNSNPNKHKGFDKFAMKNKINRDTSNFQVEEKNPNSMEIEKSEPKPKTIHGFETGEPPIVVVVQGGKGSGKTTLIKSLVKYYTGKSLKTVEGNVTIRNSKNQRITFVECDNSLYSLIDLSKIVDIALVLIDASIGFEFETFEFISLMKNHGYTNVLGVLTHMDNFPENKSLSKMKKQIKKRFQKEATEKSKLFYLYGVQNYLYQKIQIHNLARYLKVIKKVSIPYRTNTPYIVSDKFIIHNENIGDGIYSRISFFGYVRGNSFNKNRFVYINGCGDYKIENVKIINDPCPYEVVVVNGEIRRTLKQKENTIFAPWCKINNIEFDKKDGYITIPERFQHLTKRNTNEEYVSEGIKMIRDMQSKDVDENNQSFQDEEMGNNDNKDFNEDYISNDDLDDDDEDIDIVSGMKLNNNKLKEFNERKNKISGKKLNKGGLYGEYEHPTAKMNKILASFKNIKNENIVFSENIADQLEKEIYGVASNANNNHNNENNQNDFLRVKNSNSNNINTTKSNRSHFFKIEHEYYKDISDSKLNLKFLTKNSRKYFVTSNYNEEDILMNNDDNSSEKSKEYNVDKLDKEIEKEPQIENKENNGNTQNFIESKDVNEFINEDYGYYKYGKFVRVDLISLKKNVVEKFTSKKPIILFSVDIQEQATAFMKIKLSKHLYYPKILKSGDPIIYSIGCRRFQTTSTFCVEDKHLRLRQIKYTPKFDACFAVSYGPIMPIYQRVVAFQNIKPDLPHLRICATGDLLEVNQSFSIMKKLKLIGEPLKIEKKTAFVKGMFNSALEVSKYIGAEITTVSGIRGQIKKQENFSGNISNLIPKIKDKEVKGVDSEELDTVNLESNINKGGCFRATFEDKILKSDLIVLKTWVTVPIEPFYNPILDYVDFKFMKTTSEVRLDKGISLDFKKDSEYKEIVRKERVFPKFMISNVSFNYIRN